ncbi:MAG TPA: hypothetical protein VE954_24675 [Oligoflexus sp.]|uniref:hypothetical protein n=1 Tax=Oligoflexus sp. TaxID=1971216 RepID=UPI002D6A4BB1|nr:hypothetical protein [Oligoflexus sp.]HYX36312.1 hypothetical protein [Oligoflexus sp.]
MKFSKKNFLFGLALLFTTSSVSTLAFSAPVPPEQKQIDAMNLWQTSEAVTTRFESEGNRYCTGTVDTAVCQYNHDEALATGCVSPEYSQLIRSITHDSGIGYYPICQIYAVTPVKRSVLAGFCKCGCVDPSTTILAVDQKGQYQWQTAKQLASKNDIFSLAVPTADFFAKSQGPKLGASRYASLVGKGLQKELITLSLANGRALKVTSEHGILLATGKVVAAGNISTDDQLLDTIGNAVAIEAIRRESVVLDPHNFSVNAHSLDPRDHFVIAEGVVIGDESFQNGLSNVVGRIKVRAE